MNEALFPTKFEIRMKLLLGDKYEDYKRSVLDELNVRGLRVNTKKYV